MAYISKEEKKIAINDPTGKWSDMTLLPEWSEKFYDVYTAKKYGKWVMLKALKAEYANDPKYQDMLDKEFETRYNLAHANIVMVNDYEDVPGIGRAIITDDVYGYSLRRLIDEKRLTPKIVNRLETQLVDALQYIQENHLIHHPITPDRIIFTEYTENLKLIDVGYDQTDSLSRQDTEEDIKSYGRVLQEVLDNLPEKLPNLQRVAKKCMSDDKCYGSMSEVRLALERRRTSQLLPYLICFIILMVALLIILGLK